MTTYISSHDTKKAFKAAAIDNPHIVPLRDYSIQPGSKSGTISQLFAWGIKRFTVTNDKRQWFAEVTQGKRGQAVVK